MTKEQVDMFLEGKFMLQMSTLDEKGEPNVQPVWFYHDKNSDKLLIITSKIAKKTRNLKRNPISYFSIDDENFPYKGVKGKGTATIIEDPKRTVSYGEKIYMKYLGTLYYPVPMMILDSAKKGNHVVLEISPKFFSTWDFPKVQ